MYKFIPATVEVVRYQKRHSEPPVPRCVVSVHVPTVVSVHGPALNHWTTRFMEATEGRRFQDSVFIRITVFVVYIIVNLNAD